MPHATNKLVITRAEDTDAKQRKLSVDEMTRVSAAESAVSLGTLGGTPPEVVVPYHRQVVSMIATGGVISPILFIGPPGTP